MGRWAVEYLLRLRGSSEPAHDLPQHLMPCPLVERGSVADARQLSPAEVS